MALTKNFSLYVTRPEDDPRVIEWRSEMAGSENSNMTKIDELLASAIPVKYAYNDLSFDSIQAAYTEIAEAVKAGRTIFLSYEDYILPLIQIKDDRYIFGYIIDETNCTTVTISTNAFTTNTTPIGGANLSDDIPIRSSDTPLAGDSEQASRADHVHPLPYTLSVRKISADGDYSDINECTEEGWYYCPDPNGVSNVPSAVKVPFVLTYQKNGENSGIQIMSLTSSTMGMFYHTRSNGTWYSWQTVLTTTVFPQMVDAEVSDESTRPIQNKAIKKYVDDRIGEILEGEF